MMLDDARSIWELVERRVDATPDRVMLYDGDRATTFAQFRDMAERAAAGLIGLGVGLGVNVSWQLPTWTESAVLVGAPPLEGKLELDPLVLFGISEKKLMGCFLGSCNSLRDIPRMVAMWQAGQLDLEALVTAHRPLTEINEAFTDLAAGVGIRTVIDLV